MVTHWRKISRGAGGWEHLLGDMNDGLGQDLRASLLCYYTAAVWAKRVIENNIIE